MNWGRAVTVLGLVLFLGGLVATLGCLGYTWWPLSRCAEEALITGIGALLFTR